MELDHQRLSRSLLEDLVLEDVRALWEIDPAAASLFPGLSAAERRGLASTAIRELINSGSAYLFTLGDLEPDLAAADPRLRIDQEEADRVIARAIAGGDLAVGRETWIAPTEAGRKLVTERRSEPST